MKYSWYGLNMTAYTFTIGLIDGQQVYNIRDAGDLGKGSRYLNYDDAKFVRPPH